MIVSYCFKGTFYSSTLTEATQMVAEILNDVLLTSVPRYNWTHDLQFSLINMKPRSN